MSDRRDRAVGSAMIAVAMFALLGASSHAAFATGVVCGLAIAIGASNILRGAKS